MSQIQKVFCVHDSKAEIYLKPFLYNSAAEAIRGFEEVANDKKTMIGRYPSDYTLFEIGEWSDTSGEYSMHTAKINLGLALDYVKNNLDKVAQNVLKACEESSHE